ncbi:uncharacterized protein N7469_002875 [Penicillium citrinum]|uniref:Pre-mRNA-splicing factor 38 n=1 Tax=Penicillium citrinum TaxID=5077 RepID=A0A9W9TVS3_PENCI|nr:uncharacterized protein N7469_002875 [Penicillium citrinum]KAJ5241284.1 hypothetical protein N7469_002875 [Penicillium citrinum]
MDDEEGIGKIGMSTMRFTPLLRLAVVSESALELHDIRNCLQGLFWVGRATIDKEGLGGELLSAWQSRGISTSLQSIPPHFDHPVIAVMASHRADASTFLDNRGYTGPLVRGVNPVTLFEKAVRDRITDSYYWKEQCFGLNAATLCDRAVELSSIGGTYGVSEKPTPFLCLAFKLLQLNPDRNVILEYLNFTDPGSEEEEDNGVVKDRGDFKYLRALAAFYVRLTFDAVDVYKTLEPLLLDYRKLKRRIRDTFALTYMDQFVDDLLTKDRVCDMLDERISPLQEELEELDRDSDSGKSDSGKSDSGKSDSGKSDSGKSDNDREHSGNESAGKGNEEDD